VDEGADIRPLLFCEASHWQWKGSHVSAQGTRLAISLCAMAVALFAFMQLPGWAGVIAAGISVALGAGIAEVVFRRLADAETRRADLEDRVRNPPIGREPATR
jgi:hypothetical protein